MYKNNESWDIDLYTHSFQVPTTIYSGTGAGANKLLRVSAWAKLTHNTEMNDNYVFITIYHNMFIYSNNLPSTIGVGGSYEGQK